MQENIRYNLIKELSASLSLPNELAAILVARGIDTVEKAKMFLHPQASDLTSPNILEGMSEAVSIINKHIQAKSNITIFGDYDCDGIGASAILYLALKELGGNPAVFIPGRQEDGYGLSLGALKKVIERDSPGLIITVDCGIGSAEEVKYARSLGIDFIVTDHHEPQNALPDCTCINPKLQKGVCEYCGAGVVFKLVDALAGREFALNYVDICAISTIADLVPLRGENRIIARLGLDKLSSRGQRQGIKALLNAAGVKTYGKKVSSYDVAFKIAPRLNASGRLSNAEKSFRLLIDDDPTMLSLIAAELDLENKRRQELCQQTIDEAVSMLKDYDLINNRVIVLAGNDWEGGVIGIAAAKLTQDYYRPTILFTRKDNLLKGSCRSIMGINICDILNGAAEYILQFGGHSMAAGLSIDPANLSNFTRVVNNYVSVNYLDSLFFDDIRYDVEADIKKIDSDFARALECFEPYGNDNPMPMFLYKANSLPFKRIGNYNHIKYSANKGCELVCFNAYDKIDTLISDMPKSLYFTVEREIFRNVEKAQCHLRNITIDDINPKEESLLLDYLNSLLSDNLPATQLGTGARRPSALYGHLVITYRKSVFDALCKRYPQYKRAYRSLESPNPYNTVLLAPRQTKTLLHYSLVEIYDELYDETAAAELTPLSADIGATMFDVEVSGFDIDCIREIYIFLLTAANGSKYFGQDELYAMFLAKQYSRSRLCFDISCLILREVGLFSIENSSIIIKNRKVDIEASKIYSKLGTLCKLS